ncbi:MAG: metallophosphoesterase family protein [Bacteroidetes bacterium]|nr:metallophosphoesterase family protein [Bacteroidota bacterium]
MKLGILSDIHEDVVGLEKALKLLEKKGCDEIACLGDIVGFSDMYYPFRETCNAAECIRLVRENCRYSLAGNHDLFVAKKIPEYTAGFNYPENWYQLTLSERLIMADRKVWDYLGEPEPDLDEKSLHYLKELPEYLVIETERKKLFLSHFNYPDLTGSRKKYPSSPLHLIGHFRFAEKHGCTVSFSGHGHYVGLLTAGKLQFRERPFGVYDLRGRTYFIGAPCVAEGRKESGVMIFDTGSFSVESISIKDF